MEVYFLLDNSGSMDGEPINIACNIIKNLSTAFCKNSITKDSSKGSIIGYNIVSSMICPLNNMTNLSIPSSIPCSGPKNLGEALRLANENITDTQDSCLFIITKGNPSDLQMFKEQFPRTLSRFKNIIVIHGNTEKSSFYQGFIQNILPWNTINGTKLISKLYGGQEIIDADGREFLQAPPSIIEISI